MEVFISIVSFPLNPISPPSHPSPIGVKFHSIFRTIQCACTVHGNQTFDHIFTLSTKFHWEKGIVFHICGGISNQIYDKKALTKQKNIPDSGANKDNNRFWVVRDEKYQGGIWYCICMMYVHSRVVQFLATNSMRATFASCLSLRILFCANR